MKLKQSLWRPFFTALVLALVISACGSIEGTDEMIGSYVILSALGFR